MNEHRSSLSPESSEIILLAEGCFSDSLSLDEFTRLSRLLLESEEARSVFVRCVCDLNNLRRLRVHESSSLEKGIGSLLPERPEEGFAQKAPDAFFDDAEASGDALPKIDVIPASLSRRFHRFDSIHWQRHKIRFNAMTAVLTALAWVGFIYFVWYSTTPDDSRPNPQGEDFNFVAYISGVHEHQWATEMRAMAPNSSMAAGEQLQLAEGLIEITFFDGAVVVLEGPTEFVVDSRGAGTLELGKLTAHVSEQAAGFTIDTPMSTIVDLGTQFGVHVTASGTEVHVFKGQVEYSAAGAPPSDAPVKLSAGEAVRIAAVGGAVVHSSVDRERFTLDLPGRLRRDFTSYEEIVLADGPIAYWPLRDRGIHVGRDLVGNHPGKWQGSATGAVVGDVTTFDGLTNYVEVPFSEQLNQEAFTVELWVKVWPGVGGFRSPLTSRCSAEGLAGFAIYVSPSDLWEFWTSGESGPEPWARLKGPPLMADQWTYLVATVAPDIEPSSESPMSNVQFFVNGVKVAEHNVSYRANESAPLRIGVGTHETGNTTAFHFCGQIADVAAYNTVLSFEQIREHHESGKVRH